MTLHETLTLTNGQEAALQPNMVMMQGLATDEKPDVRASASELGLSPLSAADVFGSDKPQDQSELNANQHLGFFATESKISEKSLAKLRENARAQGLVVALVYATDAENPNTYFAVLPNVLVISDTDQGEERLAALQKRFGAKINAHKSQYLTNKLYLELDPDADNDAIDAYVASAGDGTAGSIFIERVPMIVPTCGVPNDTFFADQWNLQQIEWHKSYVNCTQTSVIAILDQGVDLGHPDLNFASNGLNLGTLLPDGSPTGNHGTPCAGIAAAEHNNNQGVAGVSPKSKILPIATTNWSDVQIAMGINYATQFGADVISMSFGVYDSWGIWDYAVIDPELVYATNNGMVLVAASGNENQPMNRYPGKHPLVICVGGSNRADKRKAKNDGSIEGFWGASYGYETYQGNNTGVSVVAPCLEIPATDILGGGGYDPTDYTMRFNGTSSATPMVAGLAALIKTHVPSAGNSLVRKIIEQSADKIGGYNYAYNSDFPNSSWTQEVGHGRINVRKAMRMVESLCCGSTSCCCDHDDSPVKSGQTKPGATDWQVYSASGVYLDVDTSSAGFKKTPLYFTSLGGRSHHWSTNGATSIYQATATGFRVYVRHADGRAFTPADANKLEWHINWHGVEL